MLLLFYTVVLPCDVRVRFVFAYLCVEDHIGKVVSILLLRAILRAKIYMLYFSNLFI